MDKKGSSAERGCAAARRWDVPMLAGGRMSTLGRMTGGWAGGWAGSARPPPSGRTATKPAHGYGHAGGDVVPPWWSKRAEGWAKAAVAQRLAGNAVCGCVWRAGVRVCVRACSAGGLECEGAVEVSTIGGHRAPWARCWTLCWAAVGVLPGRPAPAGALVACG